MRRSSRATARAAIALGLALLVGGCAGLPMSGTVRTETVDPTIDESTVLAQAVGPQRGATPIELLQGFIRAGRGPQEGYRVAREFLTGGFSQDWRPSARVVITNSPISPTPVDEDTFEVEVLVVARVDATGVYTELATPEQETLVYDLEQNDDGEWRVSSAPDGTVLSRTRFDNTFKEFPLYYFDASGAFLVPDLRWFPNIPGAKDRIVAELLAGQAPWLASGVLVTDFPTGTRAGDPVEIDAGEATVDFASGSDVALQSTRAKQRMLQQLDASLGSLRQVQRVRMTVGGFPVTVPDGGEQADRILTVATSPVGLSEEGFGFLTGGTNVTRIDDLSDKVEALSPLGASLGRDRDAVGVLGAGGASFVIRNRPQPLTVDQRQGLIAPSLDPYGFLWAATEDLSGGIVAYDSGGGAHLIDLGAPAGSTLVSLDVSRDGTRLLVALQTPQGPQLSAWGIVRDESLAPVRLGDVPLSLPIGSDPILDATWVDATTVAALSRTGETSPVRLLQLGGTVRTIGAVPAGQQLVGGNGVDGIRVLGAEGTVYRPSGTLGWQATSIVASFLATQQ